MIQREGRKGRGPGPETMRADMLLPVPVPRAGRQQVQGRGLRRNRISGFSETSLSMGREQVGHKPGTGVVYAHPQS